MRGYRERPACRPAAAAPGGPDPAHQAGPPHSRPARDACRAHRRLPRDDRPGQPYRLPRGPAGPGPGQRLPPPPADHQRAPPACPARTPSPAAPARTSAPPPQHSSSRTTTAAPGEPAPRPRSPKDRGTDAPASPCRATASSSADATDRHHRKCDRAVEITVPSTGGPARWSPPSPPAGFRGARARRGVPGAVRGTAPGDSLTPACAKRGNAPPGRFGGGVLLRA